MTVLSPVRKPSPGTCSVALPFGAGAQTVLLPASTEVVGPSDSLGRCTEGHTAADSSKEVQRAVEPGLTALDSDGRLRRARRIAVCVTDGTRPTPVELMLPVLLRALLRACPELVELTCVMATGLHQPVGLERLVAGVARAGLTGRVGVLAHDAHADDLVEVGTTSSGTPVLINATVARADVVLCVGVITAHAEAGYSGGAKCVVPGVAGAKTIAALHDHARQPLELRGELRCNPFRAFLEEAAGLLGSVHVLNAVLHACGQVARAELGPPVSAHRQACAWFATRYGVALPQNADVLILGAGGAPTDSSLYLAEGKAWRTGLDLIGAGTAVVLVAACEQGVGGADFAAALTGADCSEHAERKARFLRSLITGARASYLVHSGLPCDVVATLGVTGATSSAQEAVDRALAAAPASHVVAVPNPNFVVWTAQPDQTS
ncbi:lactate racemase domain-containing protein [Streptomyces cellostaticus]|uniref:lactate racemase domain-containing protein n=1 Tax=Streptomyces cellostaticus TaxID=67285 RepID=UPI002026B640|nr:lactate racemase domain-containing protein [Streptomyces cellostaticus]